MNAMSNPDMAAAFASMMRNNSGVQLNMTRRKQLMPSAASAQVEPLMLANGPAASHNLESTSRHRFQVMKNLASRLVLVQKKSARLVLL